MDLNACISAFEATVADRKAKLIDELKTVRS